MRKTKLNCVTRQARTAPAVSPIGAYNEHMAKSLTFISPKPTLLRVEVTSNDADDTFETSVHCSQNDCHRIVDIDSEGPKTLRSVSCPKHGFLTSFPHQSALGEFVRVSANEILAANGRELIETEALFIIGNIEPHARSGN